MVSGGILLTIHYSPFTEVRECSNAGMREWENGRMGEVRECVNAGMGEWEKCANARMRRMRECSLLLCDDGEGTGMQKDAKTERR